MQENCAAVTGADATSEGLSWDADWDAEQFTGWHPTEAHPAISLQTRTNERRRWANKCCEHSLYSVQQI